MASYCLLLAWCIGFGDCGLGLRRALRRRKPTVPPSLLLQGRVLSGFGTATTIRGLATGVTAKALRGACTR